MCTPSNRCFLGPTRVHNPNGIWINSVIFENLTGQRPYTLQWAASPSKMSLLVWGDLYTRTTHGSLGPPESTTQTVGLWTAVGQLDWFVRFCRAHNRDRQTDPPTDHATPSVIIGRIYVRSTAMRPNNNRAGGTFGLFAAKGPPHTEWPYILKSTSF